MSPLPEHNILLVLGAPNSPEGLLSAMALSRLDTCYDLYTRGDYLIMLTGGFGPHFNTSNKAHAWYTRQYLLGKGVPAQHIIGMVESANTVEDARLSKEMLMQRHPASLTVITSEYHLLRAGIIFEAVYRQALPLYFIAAPSCDLSLSQMQAALQHEKKAVRDLLLNGVRY